MEFKPLTPQDQARLRRYYESCDLILSEYSVAGKLMLREAHHPVWAEAAGCLIVRNTIHGKRWFDYPVAGPEGDESAALEAIEAWCLDNEVPLAVSAVPADRTAMLLKRYPMARIVNLKSWRDYVYAASDLRDYPGRRYAGQRSQANKFRGLYPDARFRALGEGDEALAEAFFDEFEKALSKHSETDREDLANAREMMRMMDRPCFLCGGMELDGKLLSLAMGERCGETLHVHIEKALCGYEGVHPATIQAYAQYYADLSVRWLNREDSADDRGLRASRLRYRPAFLAEKCCFEVQNELEKLALDHETEPIFIKTARLTLTPLTDADREAYTRLCLDDARNRFWGYDYRKDWRGEPLEDYFLEMARADFASHTALNLAVRLDGKLIGEVVLHRFTGRGSAELGCRIAPDYAGRGYGAEAFAAAADWGLCRLRLEAVTAKCYKENAASERMLQSCMRRSGEDETFYYFRKEV